MLANLQEFGKANLSNIWEGYSSSPPFSGPNISSSEMPASFSRRAHLSQTRPRRSHSCGARLRPHQEHAGALRRASESASVSTLSSLYPFRGRQEQRGCYRPRRGEVNKKAAGKSEQARAALGASRLFYMAHCPHPGKPWGGNIQLSPECGRL